MGRWQKTSAAMAAALSLAYGPAPAHADNAVLLSASRIPIRIGAHSPFATFKQRLHERHALCHPDSEALRRQDRPFEFSEATRRVIAETAACALDSQLPRDTSARRGDLTVELWQAILPALPLPTVEDRIDAMTLSFEATDFSDPPIWNFCQDSPGPAAERAASIRSGSICYNATDPCSMLTWGPRGATAGQGAEIQWILWRLSREAPALLADAFGNEHAAVQRFVRLKRGPPDSCDGNSPTEHFMCAAWLDDARRQAWEQGLLTLGRSVSARRVYQQIYAGLEFDGYKIKAYFDLWHGAGLAPTEIDYAFFFDRATHSGAPPAIGSPPHSDFQRCIAAPASAPVRNAVARRCLSLAQPHPSQPVDRLGRDVAYYRTAFPAAALSARETETWERHIPLDATTSFGLSDNRQIALDATRIRPLDARDHPPQSETTLTKDERECPLRIRNPLRRAPPR